jgi:hypothetical protein
MPVPRIMVYLTPGTGTSAVDIAAYLSQESGAVLTNTIENPTDTNNFTAADVSLKGYDPTGYIKGLLAGILPTSTDFGIYVDMALFNSALGGYTTDISLDGFIAPATVQFNPKDKSFAFTVIGNVRKLQTTSAASLFKRPNYFDSKWTLNQDATPADGISPSIRVQSSTGNSTCDFFAGDQVQIGDNEQFVVTNVSPDTTSSPPAYWVLGISDAPKKTYAAGTFIKLLSVYARNVSLHDVVEGLYNAAGFPAEGYFGSAALPNLGALFATPINMSGLPAGPVSGVSPFGPFGTTLIAGTPGGIYRSNGPTSPFTFLAPYKLAPVDPTNTNTTYVYTGPKRTRTRNNVPRYGINVTMKFYAYDSFQYGGTFNRYILTVTCNEDVVDTGGTFGGFAFTTKLEWETYDTGLDTWGGTTTLWAGVSSTTLTELSAAYDAIGIDVDPATGTCFFTDLDVGGAGQQINMNTSAYQPTGATITTGTLARNKATGVNGPTCFMAPGQLAVFQVDGILGNSARVLTYTTVANGTMTLVGTQSISPYVVGRSVKQNKGNGAIYGLISDPVNGIYLKLWSNWTFGGIDYTPDLLFPPPPNPSQSTNLLQKPYEVDLICLPTAGGPGSGRYPMVALIGGTPQFISNQGSGLIPYVDLTDLSVADALQQLTVINAGIFYVVPSGWFFRSRSGPAPGYTIGVNDQIDGDAGFLSLTNQNVFNRWVGYVRIEHETDATIFGEAGDSAFADTDQGLTLKSRFVSSKSFAAALATSLYNYLGAQKRWIEIERLRDGRVYGVGRTFHCNVDGVNRNFQIIETGHPVCGVTVKVVGLEV